jgi:ribosomal protein S1
MEGMKVDRCMSMIHFGESVKARVVSVNDEEAEVILAYRDEKILLLPPEMSWAPTSHDLRAEFKEGDDILVRILRYAANRGCYIGSTRRVAPAENNPYVKYAKGGINAEYSAEVTSLNSVDYPWMGRVKLSDGVTGWCAFDRSNSTFQIGDRVCVFAIDVDYERGEATFRLCHDRNQEIA